MQCLLVASGKVTTRLEKLLSVLLLKVSFGLKVVEPNICLVGVCEGVVGLLVLFVLVLDKSSKACLAHAVLEQFLALVRR